MMPFVACAIPAVAFLFTELRWAFRWLMVLPIAASALLGVYNARMDFVCSYAGDLNAMLVSLLELYHIRPDLALPIFDNDLALNPGSAPIQLIIGISIALTLLFAGMVIAQQQSATHLGKSRISD